LGIAETLLSRLIAFFLACGVSQAYLLWQWLSDGVIVPRPPGLEDGASPQAIVANWCVGSMSACFILTGIALLLTRRLAIRFYVVGVVFSGFLVTTILLTVLRTVW
jgi:hypothetical protein